MKFVVCVASLPVKNGFGRNFKHAGAKKLTSQHLSSSRNRFILSIFSGPIICWKDKIFLHTVGALECRLTFQKP